MTLRRAFKKLDKNNNGYLDMQEFRSVLQLCNTVLDENEVFELLEQLDDKMEGRVDYREFLKKISRWNELQGRRGESGTDFFITL